MSFIEQFESLMEAVGMTQVSVNGWMVVQVLAIVDRGALDLADGGIDLVNRTHGIVVDNIIGTKLVEVCASVTQIAEGMQIGRMLTRGIGKHDGW